MSIVTEFDEAIIDYFHSLEKEIEGEHLDLTAPDYFRNFEEKDGKGRCQAGPHARILACLMQKEMRQKGEKFVSPKTLEAALKKANPHPGTEYDVGAKVQAESLLLLVNSWKYGVSLSYCLGMDEEGVHWARKKAELFNCPNIERVTTWNQSQLNLPRQSFLGRVVSAITGRYHN